MSVRRLRWDCNRRIYTSRYELGKEEQLRLDDLDGDLAAIVEMRTKTAPDGRRVGRRADRPTDRRTDGDFGSPSDGHKGDASFLRPLVRPLLVFGGGGDAATHRRRRRTVRAAAAANRADFTVVLLRDGRTFVRPRQQTRALPSVRPSVRPRAGERRTYGQLGGRRRRESPFPLPGSARPWRKPPPTLVQCTPPLRPYRPIDR